MANTVKIVSFALFVCTLGTFIIGFASPYWFVSEASGYGSAFGLWMACGKAPNINWKCIQIDITSEAVSEPWFAATRAMMCLGLITAIVDLVLYILSLAKDFDVRIAGGVCGGVGLFALIGVSIFGGELAKLPVVFKLGWGFALACLSCVFGIVNAIVTMVIARQ